MKSLIVNFCFSVILFLFNLSDSSQDFIGEAHYATKSTLEFGQWGNSLTTAQKKEIQERLKSRLEKTYLLVFNKEETSYEEEDRLDAISGATDTWGKNFSQGYQYKNVKENRLLQDQEFYGKKFLVNDELLHISWNLSGETKTIGNYTCFKATASVPTKDLLWYTFSWDRLRNPQNEKDGTNSGVESKTIEDMTEIEAWYTPQIPVSHGPSEFWGLPGLILQVSTDDTTILCTKIVMNSNGNVKIVSPSKGKVVTKTEYQEIIASKMAEMRDMYRSGRR